MIPIECYQPSNDSLREFISYYYFLNHDIKKEIRFSHYPHFRTTLNIYFNAKVSLTAQSRRVMFQQNVNPICIFNNNNCNYQHAEILGKMDLIGVSFNPLGINHFIENELSSYNFGTSAELPDLWQDQPNLLASLSMAKTKERIALLDEFFVSHLASDTLNDIKPLVNRILNSNGSISVDVLAVEHGLSRRTILRLFRKHLDCSVEEFKKVVKFRHVLSQHQSSSTNPKLTDLAYASDYYDQSDFIKHFKKLSGGKPGKVLDEITQVGRQDLYWNFNFTE